MKREPNFFKRVRFDQRISQDEMADRVGISRTSLAKLENGTTKVLTKSVLNFARVNDISLTELIQGCYPDEADRLREEGDQAEKLRSLISAYEARLEQKDDVIAEKQKIIDSQNDTIRAQMQVIAHYEKNSGGN